MFVALLLAAAVMGDWVEATAGVGKEMDRDVELRPLAEAVWVGENDRCNVAVAVIPVVGGFRGEPVEVVIKYDRKEGSDAVDVNLQPWMRCNSMGAHT